MDIHAPVIAPASEILPRDAYQPHEDAAALVDRAQTRMMIEDGQPTNKPSGMHAAMIETYEAMEDGGRGTKKGIETGFFDLDDLTWGLHQRDDHHRGSPFDG